MLTQKNNLFFKSSRGKEGNRGLASGCPGPPGHLGGTHRGPEQGTPCLGTAGCSWHEGTGPARAGSHRVPATGTACPCPSGSLTWLQAAMAWGGTLSLGAEGGRCPVSCATQLGKRRQKLGRKSGFGVWSCRGGCWHRASPRTPQGWGGAGGTVPARAPQSPWWGLGTQPRRPHASH